MDVAEDALLHDLGSLSIEDRCKAELDLLSRIEKAPLESRKRCELVWQILGGSPFQSIDEELKKKEVT